MKLENLISYHSPRSLLPDNLFSPKSPDSLSSEDILAVMGILQSRAPLGYSAFFGKFKNGGSDVKRAVALLATEGLKVAQAYPVLRKLSENERKAVIDVIAQYAYADWSRSAETEIECLTCKGTGLRSGNVCPKCLGKRVVRAACKDCKGRGIALDREKTAIQGVPVYKNCVRCDGRGYKRIASTEVFRAVSLVTEKITLDTWNKSLKNLYDFLITRVEQEQTQAELQLNCLVK